MNLNTTYHNFFAMGTRMDIVFPGADQETGDEVSQKIKEEAFRLEDILSIYKEDSVFSKINREAFENEVPVPEELFGLLGRLKEYHRLTLGYFDITLGKLKTTTEGSEETTNVEFMGMDKLVLNDENYSVRFMTDSIKLDPGAFGKGLLLDRIKKMLEKYGIRSAFISFGESSVLALGHHPYSDRWKVGIQDIFRQGVNVYVFDIRDASVSTSGNSLLNLSKYKEGHLINPFTGELMTKYIQLCVSCVSALEAEVLSTALVFAKNEETNQILANFENVDAVRIEYPDPETEPQVTRLSASN